MWCVLTVICNMCQYVLTVICNMCQYVLTVICNMCQCVLTVICIKSNKAGGPDGISSTIISLAGPAIISGLENIYKRSFVTRTVPISWKRAKVTPIFKKGARTDIANYRPISLLCIPSKLLT